MHEIIVTGFGKFAGQDDGNASKEAVFKLPDYLECNSKKISIKKIEVPVIYTAADEIVEKIWSNNPALVILNWKLGISAHIVIILLHFQVIHVGAHATTKKILLEKCSNTSGYCIEDINEECLDEDEICTIRNKCPKLDTRFNVEKIVKDLNSEHKPIYDVSCDVGNYLCGYIYVKSLDYDSHRTIFLHVPQTKYMNSVECKNGILKVAEKCICELIAAKKI